jgi:nucleoside-diphosphate kinase
LIYSSTLGILFGFFLLRKKVDNSIKNAIIIANSYSNNKKEKIKMSIQQTLVIVKPDGIAKGLVGQILRAIDSNGLTVVNSERLDLDRSWVENFYGSERDQVYFTEVVEWVSSAPVLFLKVQGEDAVYKVKQQIIGRYPSGIRGQYSENWIKNVAHASDSVQSAILELNLAENFFERNKNRFSGKMVFALTGMSECGKSTVGKYLDSKGIKRLKIVKLFGKVRDKWSPSQDLYEFSKKQEEKDPYSLWDAFIDELILEMDTLGTNSSSIESLYGGGLGPYLMRKLEQHFCIVFVDIPSEIRLVRQMQRENLSSIEEARQLLLPRDELKEKSGIPSLKEISGEVINNSGTLEELYRAVDKIIERYLK